MSGESGRSFDVYSDPFEVVATRDCGCRAWWFGFNPLFGGIEPPEGGDPLHWFAVATGPDRSVRTTEAPRKNEGFAGLPGPRGPRGQRHIPQVSVVEGALVLTGRNLCPHATHELKATGGRELHRWATFAEQIRAAADGGIDPRSPVVDVELVHTASYDIDQRTRRS